MTDDENVLVHLRRHYGKDEMVAYVIKRIRELKIELGQANSEIDHLNEELNKTIKNKNLNQETDKEARKEAKKEEIFKQNREEILNLRAKNKRLSKDNSDLIVKLLTLEKHK